MNGKPLMAYIIFFFGDYGAKIFELAIQYSDLEEICRGG